MSQIDINAVDLNLFKVFEAYAAIVDCFSALEGMGA